MRLNNTETFSNSGHFESLKFVDELDFPRKIRIEEAPGCFTIFIQSIKNLFTKSTQSGQSELSVPASTLREPPTHLAPKFLSTKEYDDYLDSTVPSQPNLDFLLIRG